MTFHHSPLLSHSSQTLVLSLLPFPYQHFQLSLLLYNFLSSPLLFLIPVFFENPGSLKYEVSVYLFVCVYVIYAFVCTCVYRYASGNQKLMLGVFLCPFLSHVLMQVLSLNLKFIALAMLEAKQNPRTQPCLWPYPALGLQTPPPHPNFTWVLGILNSGHHANTEGTLPTESPPHHLKLYLHCKNPEVCLQRVSPYCVSVLNKTQEQPPI